MARIAIAVGIGVLGAVTGGLAAAGFGIFAGTFAGGSVLGGIALGASIGFSAGNVLGGLLFGQHSTLEGPRLTDTQISSSAPGSPIPIGYGGFRIGCQIIWSTGIRERKNTQTQSAKGGPSQTTTTYSYTCSFAAVACKGPAHITRIWADSKLIFDSTGKGAVTAPALATGIGTNTTVALPAIYPGDETQLPDPTIQAAQGVNKTSAHRGLCYIVYEDLPLADFGNRLPNIRAEVSKGTVTAFIKDVYPPIHTFSPNPGGTPGIYPADSVFVGSAERAAFFLGGVDCVVQKIDLVADNTVPLDIWQPNTVMALGQQILDSNGNVQTVYQPFPNSDNKTGSTQPTWTTGITDQVHDNHVTWLNTGPGPEAIPVLAEGVLNPLLHSGEVYANRNANFKYSSGVDTQGNFWGSPIVSIGGSNKNFAIKYDRQTFNAISRIDITPCPITGMSFIKTVKGDKAYFTTGSGVSAGSFYVVDVSTMHVDCVVDLSAFVNRKPAIAISPSGVAYIISLKDGSHWQLVEIDPRSGLPIVSAFTYSYTGADTPSSLLYNTADNSLLMFFDTGFIKKFDAATGTLLSTSSTQLLAAGTNLSLAFTKSFLSGQVPSSGILTIPDMLVSIIYLDATTFQVQQTLPFVDWSSGFGGLSFSPVDFAYDTLTDSMLMVAPGNSVTYRLFMNRQTVSGQTLDTVVSDLLLQTGMLSSQFDVTALSGITVLGYPIARLTDAKSCIAPLAQAYFFDLVESDFKLKAVLRGGATSVSIPEADLGIADTSGNSFELQTTFAQQHDLPKDVTVLYADPALDYQQGKQMRRRHSRVIKTKNQTVLQLPLTLNGDTAAQIGQKFLSAIWAERNLYAWKLWKAKYLVIEPTDTVQFTYGSSPYISRIIKTNAGQNRQLEISGVSENTLSYSSGVAGVKGSGFPAQSLNAPANTLLMLLDLPLLQDSDAPSSGSTGFYWAMSSPVSGWPGGVLYNSADNQSFNQLDFSSNEIPYGTVALATPSPRSPWSWDNVTQINVRMVQGTLSSTSQLNVLNGANGFLLGNEVMQFTTAVLNSDGSYTLSGLLRGRRGTEWACSSHIGGETFILLGSNLHRTTTSTSLVNAVRYYKGVTVGQNISSAIAQQFTQQGNDLKPYAVAQLAGTKDVSGNFNLSWIRRTRIGGSWLDGTGTVPLAEDNESYDVDVLLLNGNGVSPFPKYAVSPPNAMSVVQLTKSLVGVSVTALDVSVAPFTVNWADGHSAIYSGFDFGFPSTGSGYGLWQYVTVFDPTRSGVPGTPGPGIYAITNDATLANTPGYVFLGRYLMVNSAQPNPIVTIGGSDVVLRTFLNLPSPSLTYTDSQIRSDYGASVNFLRVIAYQNSAQIGRGFPAENDAVGVSLGSINGS